MHHQPECTVSGVLSFILYISLIGGMAPIKFEKERTSWRIRLSRFYLVYGILVMIILQGFSAASLVYSKQSLIDAYEARGFMRYLNHLYLIMQIALGIIVVFTSWNRFHHLIDCITRLEQIKNELDRLRRPLPTSETKMWFVIIGLLIFAYVGTFTEYVLYMYDVITVDSTVQFNSIAFVAPYLFLVQMQLLPMQFLLVALRLVSMQKRLNYSLEGLLQEIYKNRLLSDHSTLSILKHFGIQREVGTHFSRRVFNSNTNQEKLAVGNTDFKTHPELLEQLTNIYCSLCDIIRQLNESNGLPLIMLFLYVIFNFVTLPYLVVHISRNASEISFGKALSTVMWNIVSISCLIIVIEPCHQTHIQLYLTKYLITEMLRYSPRESPAIYYELKIFKRHILLNPVTYNPMQLFTFNRYVLLTVFTTAITYLSVVINL